MNKKHPFKEYLFTRKAVEWLLGEKRSTVAYHIKRLQDCGYFGVRARTKCMHRQVEGCRFVMREIDVLTVIGLRVLARSFDTPRARRVEFLCDEVIVKNRDADYTNIDMEIVG